MNIISTKPFTSTMVITDEDAYSVYIRYSSEYWEHFGGGEVIDCSKLESVYQQHVKQWEDEKLDRQLHPE